MSTMEHHRVPGGSDGEGGVRRHARRGRSHRRREALREFRDPVLGTDCADLRRVARGRADNHRAGAAGRADRQWPSAIVSRLNAGSPRCTSMYDLICVRRTRERRPPTPGAGSRSACRRARGRACPRPGRCRPHGSRRPEPAQQRERGRTRPAPAPVAAGNPVAVTQRPLNVGYSISCGSVTTSRCDGVAPGTGTATAAMSRHVSGEMTNPRSSCEIADLRGAAARRGPWGPRCRWSRSVRRITDASATKRSSDTPPSW